MSRRDGSAFWPRWGPAQHVPPTPGGTGDGGTCGCCWAGCDTRLCPVRGDSCVPSEPTQPLLHHQNTNEPNLALFQPQVLPGEQRFVQDHGTAPGTRLHKKVLSPRSVCVGEGTQGFGGQRDLLQPGRFAHEPAVN